MYAFVEFLLSQKPDFVAEKLRPAYMAYAREFLEREEIQDLAEEEEEE